jgi:hypothetical protein
MTVYRIDYSDVALAEADAAYLWRSQVTAPGEGESVGIVRVLRVVHGASRP